MYYYLKQNFFFCVVDTTLSFVLHSHSQWMKNLPEKKLSSLLSQGRRSTKIVGGEWGGEGQGLKKYQPQWLTDEENIRF